MGESLYNRLPVPVKASVDRVLGLIPPAWRQRRVERRTMAFLKQSEFWSWEQWRAYQDRQVRALVAYAYERVPYYRAVWKERGIHPSDIHGVDALRLLPLIDNRIMTEQIDALQATGIPTRVKQYVTTGGTMGRPNRFLAHRRISQDTERAHIQDMWRRVGYHVGDRRIILRVGEDPKHGPLETHYFDHRLNAICFRSFLLSEPNLDVLAGLIREFRPDFLHTYPSAAAMLALHVQRRNITDLPPIQAALLSSESFYPEQRDLVEKYLKTRFFSWYGHAEHLILAGECEHTADYHAYPGYGVLEVVDEQEQPVDELGTAGMLVGTGFANPVMPLIRYRTGDWGRLIAYRCPDCKRSFPILRDVRGHYAQEMIVHQDGHLTSVTGVNLHGDGYKNVRQYQVHQREAGKITFRIVRTEDYGPVDEALIRHMIQQRFGDDMEIRFEYVDHIPATARGKWKFLIQELNTGRTWARPQS